MMTRNANWQWAGTVATLLLLTTACGSGSSGGDSTTTAPANLLNRAEASRFLSRATFGPRSSDMDSVVNTGYSQWITNQVALPATLIAPKLLAQGCSAAEPGVEEGECDPFIDPFIAERDRLWYEHAVYAPDQLRQRVAFALSEIFVISQFNAVLEELPVLMADYYDLLVNNAFGNYRVLLEEVTLHPAMGAYLSMLQNRKADPVLGTRPDENFAREVMQLFSIGLVQLDPSGQVVLDGNGQPIPTYTQQDIEALSRVFTGWTWASDTPQSDDLFEFLNQLPRFGRMEAWPAFHDDGPKVIVGGVSIPGGQTAEADLAMALDAIANHANVGPFISKQLIQRLVTSNPSPAYVGRVAAVFANDGNGVRGNLDAVVRAILLDDEAIAPAGTDPNFGKIREPLLRITAVLRAFDAQPGGPRPFTEYDTRYDQGQQAFYSPSVFNFFSPFYASTPLANSGLVAPELQISTHSYLTNLSNYMQATALYGNAHEVDGEWILPLVNFDSAMAVADDAGALIDHLDELLLGGTLSPGTRSRLLPHIQGIPFQDDEGPDGLYRASEAAALITLSPDFAVQQ